VGVPKLHSDRRLGVLHVKLKKPLSFAALLAVLVVLGAVALVAGVYLLEGLAAALIVGGAGAVAVGLLVDAG
jgi:hypothetical protein